jgi:sulfonate transport system substrate-binding protein
MARLSLPLPSLIRALAAAALLLPLAAAAADNPKELRLDYAYYSPPSLVIRKLGWAEQEFRKDGTEVKWVLSAGSNRALEYLQSNAVDFGSTAGLAAVLSRANGNPIKTVYVFSRPEWTALVVGKDSPIKSIEDLKGKKVAATKGTDPFLFLLRSLNDKGLHKGDVEIVHLQHADGRAALEQKRVDAWAGLDPIMASAELDSGARLIYRNVAYNTYGFLNTPEAFLKAYPGHVRRVIALYERAKTWIRENPEETAKLIAEEAKLPVAVAKLQLTRNDFSISQPGATQSQALKAAAPILLQEDLVRPGTDVNKVIDSLLDSAPPARAAAQAGSTAVSAR